MAEKDRVYLQKFSPSVTIDLFANQRMLCVGDSRDGAGVVDSIEALPHGVVVTFTVAKQKDRRMLLSAAGWGWLT